MKEKITKAIALLTLITTCGFGAYQACKTDTRLSNDCLTNPNGGSCTKTAWLYGTCGANLLDACVSNNVLTHSSSTWTAPCASGGCPCTTCFGWTYVGLITTTDYCN